MKYSYVLRWTIIHILIEVIYEKLVHDITSSDKLLRLPLAGRKPLARPCPLANAWSRVANAAADPHVSWAVAPHSSLGQPRRADAQKIGHVPFGKQGFEVGGGLGVGFVDFSIHGPRPCWQAHRARHLWTSRIDLQVGK
jgi:hypothetical protein